MTSTHKTATETEEQTKEDETDDLQPYYDDVIKLFAESKETKPLNFIATYFENVAAQQHILFRKFEFISQTVHNRHSFISQFNTIFENFYSSQMKVSGDEIHQLLCLLCPDFPTSLIYLALAIIDSKKSTSYPFIVVADVTLNVFLYWDILQYIEQLYHNKNNIKIVIENDDDSEQQQQQHEYREYVFIGEIRTSLFEYQMQFTPKKQLCDEILSKMESSTLTNKVKLLEFCKTVTMTSEYTGSEDYDKPILS